MCKKSTFYVQLKLVGKDPLTSALRSTQPPCTTSSIEHVLDAEEAGMWRLSMICELIAVGVRHDEL